MHVGPYQAIGLVGVALIAMGGLLAVVLPQLSPPYIVPAIAWWVLFAAGGLLFWIGVIGGIVEVIRGTARTPAVGGRAPPAR